MSSPSVSSPSVSSSQAITSSNRQSPVVISELATLRATVARWRAAGETVGLVPTMGALHEGHLKLVDAARAQARRVVTSIYVNPTQFAPTEDFSRYPRTFEDDCAKLADRECDVVWAPDTSVMYPDGFSTRVSVGGPAEGLETDFRPTFFSGVATVCTKLFTQVAPDIAVFGEKDFQQLAVVRRVVTDLNLPLRIVGHETVREPDGLAMSSRNRYLTPEERATAPAIMSTMRWLGGQVRTGAAIAQAEHAAAERLRAAGFQTVDYVAVRDPETLRPIAEDDAAARDGARILVAAWLGTTRLIDNIAVRDTG